MHFGQERGPQAASDRVTCALKGGQPRRRQFRTLAKNSASPDLRHSGPEGFIRQKNLLCKLKLASYFHKHISEILSSKSLSGGVFKSSFAHLKCIWGGRPLLDLVFTSTNTCSPRASHWHASPWALIDRPQSFTSTANLGNTFAHGWSLQSLFFSFCKICNPKCDWQMPS